VHSSAGEALPEEIGERSKERFGVDILDGIGSTEMLHIFLSNRPATCSTAPPARRCRATACELRDEGGDESHRGRRARRPVHLRARARRR
jgi:benzoate-CoA ligase